MFNIWKTVVSYFVVFAGARLYDLVVSNIKVNLVPVIPSWHEIHEVLISF